MLKRYSIHILSIVACTFVGILTTSSASGVPSLMGKTTFVMQVSFPTDLVLKNLGVFQSFESAVIRNTTTRLVRWRPERIEPELAERWSVSSDGKKITFYLRKNAIFSDGTPITSKDVVWSVQRHFTNKGQHTDEFLRVIEGWEQLTSPQSTIPGFRSVDDHTFEVNLTRPTPRIIYDFFGLLPASIFKRESVPANEDKIPWDYVSSGPYKISSHSDKEVSFERNQFHWLSSEKNLPERAVLKAKTSTDTLKDLVAGVIDYDDTSFNLTEIDVPYLDSKGIQFAKQEPLCRMLRPDYRGRVLSKYPKLTSYLQILIDRDSIVEKISKDSKSKRNAVYGWTAANPLLAKEFGPFSKDERSEALVQAKKSFPKVFSGDVPLTLAYASESENSKKLSQAIQSHLTSLGMHTILEPLPFADIVAEVQDGKFDLAIDSYGVTAFDPALTLPYLVGLDSRFLNLPPSHSVYGIMKQLETLPDLKGQIEMVRDFNRKLRKEGFLIPLMEEDSTRIFSARFDASRVPTNTFYVYFSDFRMKP